MTEQTDLQTSSAAPQTVPVQTTQPQDPYAEIVLPENSLLSAHTLAAFKQTAAEVNLSD